MAGFKFRLEFMISLRRRAEEAAAAKLARRLASIRELERIIASLEDELARLAEEITSKGRAGELTGPLLVMYSAHQERTRKEIRRNNDLLALSRKEEAKERRALRQAVADRKIMEKAKENQREAWAAETAKAEQGEMEELAAITKERARRCEAYEDQPTDTQKPQA
jgi:flagellar export protein FliJ